MINENHFQITSHSQCGEIHHNLGSNKTFKCPWCDYEADRDISAARNILLRYLTLENITCWSSLFWFRLFFGMKWKRRIIKMKLRKKLRKKERQRVHLLPSQPPSSLFPSRECSCNRFSSPSRTKSVGKWMNGLLVSQHVSTHVRLKVCKHWMSMQRVPLILPIIH